MRGSLAAMSGGVDSAVAAARAVDAGHDVVGVHLALSETPAALRGGSRGCCSREDAGDARRAADVLGIPFYVWDFAARFADGRRRRLRRRLRRGADPEPVPALQREDQVLGAAGPGAGAGLRRGLHRALRPAAPRASCAGPSDADKDQSYVLAVLTRRAAAARDVPAGRHGQGRRSGPRPRRAGCGWPTSRTATTSASSPPATPAASSPPGSARGRARSSTPASGEVLARHDGVHGFTVGQRRGLGLGRPAADGRPRYVLGIEPVSGTVRVGPAEALDVRSIDGGAAGVERGCGAGRAVGRAWCRCGRTAASRRPRRARRARDLRVELAEPLRGVAPGQAVALYRPDPAGDVVLGSADDHRGPLSRQHQTCAGPQG